MKDIPCWKPQKKISIIPHHTHWQGYFILFLVEPVDELKIEG
jgi:hypothetical protein